MITNQKEIQRYKMYNSPEGISCIVKDPDGDLVAFSDLKDLLQSEIKYTHYIKYSNRTVFVFDKISITYFGRLTKANREIIVSLFKLAKIKFHPQFQEEILKE